MNYFKKQPFALSGLILGLAALGNLLASYSPKLRLAIGAIAMILFVPYVIKIFTNFSDLVEELKQPLPASVFPTFPMAIMLLSTYLTPMFGISLEVAKYIWWVGLIINIIIYLYFLFKFAFKGNMKFVFPTWGVITCGFVVASVTAPLFEKVELGQWLFWIGLIGGLIVLPFMLIRVYKMRDLPAPALPTITVLCAPFSLLVAGYVSSFQGQHNVTLLTALLILAQVIYITTVVQVPRFIKGGFYPTFAALTFPLVISALSFKLAAPVLGWTSPVVTGLITLETIIATVVVFYVLFAYLKFLFTK